MVTNMITARTRTFTAALLAFAVAATTAGCTQPAKPLESSAPAAAGTTTTVGIKDGITVTVPGEAITGSGTLSVAVDKDVDSSWSRWSIALDGAELTGPAELQFHGLRGNSDEVPAPLVTSQESVDETATLMTDVVWDEEDSARVTGDRLGTWSTLSWDTIRDLTVDRIEDLYSTDPTATQPVCTNEEAAREQGVNVTGPESTRVLWCVGTDDAGQRVLQIANPSGMALSVEATAGIAMAGTADPATASQLLGAGQTNQYVVNGPGKQNAIVSPSADAHATTALLLGASTVADLAHGDVTDTAAILEAMQAVGCNDALQAASTGVDGGAVLTAAISSVIGCLDETLALVDADAAWSEVTAGFTWLADEAAAASTELAGTAEAAALLDPAGFTVEVSFPIKPTSCDQIYDQRLLDEFQGMGYVLNVPMPGLTIEDYQHFGLRDVALRDLVNKQTDELSCHWTSPSAHYGVSTRIADLVDADVSAVQARLTALNYDTEVFAGGTRHYFNETGMDGSGGESYFLRGNTLVATKWAGDAPEGYTRDLVAMLG
jgi:hypothetical protein